MKNFILLAVLIGAVTPVVAAPIALPVVRAADSGVKLFAPDMISDQANDSVPAFACDGCEAWFSPSVGKHSTILVSHREEGR